MKGDTLSEWSTETAGGGSFFKPADYATALALVIEPKQFLEDRPNGKFLGTRNEVVANIQAFMNKAQLEGASEPTVLNRVTIANGPLVRDLFDLHEAGRIKRGLIYRLEQRPNQNGGNPYYVWRSPDVAICEQVVDRLTEQDAATKAALADAPF